MSEKNAGLLAVKFIPQSSDQCLGIIELCYGHTTHSMVSERGALLTLIYASYVNKSIRPSAI
jgi:hypothetical protein